MREVGCVAKVFLSYASVSCSFSPFSVFHLQVAEARHRFWFYGSGGLDFC